MDPIRQITSPVAEVRRQATRDEYGEAWVVIDGVETKVPSIKAARNLLVYTDALRMKIREDLDAQGLRFNEDGTDREEKVEITLDDGTKTTVGLMRPGDANYMQIGSFPDAEGLFANAAKVQAKTDAMNEQCTREHLASVALAAKQARSPLAKIRDAIVSFFKGDSK